MNRYTYKAKRKDKPSEWVYGYYVSEFNKKLKINKYFILNDEEENFIEIIPETLCQCTGLQDIEGNYIFENDIVEINDKFDGIFQTNVVFKNGCFGINMSIVKQIKNPNGWDKIYDKCESLGMNTSKYKTLTKANDDMISGYGYHTDNCKIIGNKFDKEVE